MVLLRPSGSCLGLHAAAWAYRPLLGYSYKAYMQLLGLEQLLGLLAAAWEYRPLIGLQEAARPTCSS